MKKNLIIVLLVFIVPLVAYFVLNKTSNSQIAVADDATAKPQIIKFTSAMCLDCQEMNKIIKEIFPKYQDKMVLIEIPVQDGKAFTEEQIKKYNVTLVPTIILIDSKGNQVKRIEGAIPKEEMESCLEGLK